MSETDYMPRVARVIATINAAAAGIERPGAGVKTVRVARVDEDVGNHVVLTSADAADQSPIRAFIVGKENVAVGSAEAQFLNIVGIGFEAYNRSARRANLTPCLRRR